MRRIFKFLFSKLFLTGAVAFFELALVLVMIFRFSDAFVPVNVALVVLKLISMITVVNSELPPAYKISWLAAILLNTVVGVTLYFFFGRVKLRRSALERMNESRRTLCERKEKYDNAKVDDAVASKICSYLGASCNSAAFGSNHTEFFSVGEKFFDRLQKELERAESYIYLDYFIVRGGKVWDRLFEILEKKVKCGVDVRLIYDDFGSVMKIDSVFMKRLCDSGIKFKAFNKISPSLSSRQNYRDHRKVCVIDGNTAFVGGINLSDEYANITHPLNHWKDTAVIIKGSAVEVFANEFLSAFSGLLSRGDKIEEFMSLRVEKYDEKGIVSPYFDTPFENRQVCRDLYATLISSAEKSICITTPYFVPDYVVENAIKNALQCGVKVRIVIPGTYDKWYVREISQMYAARLEKYGAEIYLYSPGFIHQKMLVVDSLYAVTGSSNLDYRSFYLSFESGVFMYDTASVGQMVDDFEKTVGCSEPLPAKAKNVGVIRGLFRQIFAIFSPLM